MEGKIYSYPSVVDNGLLHTDFHLEPAGSLLLYYSNHILKGYPEAPAIAGNTKLAASKSVEVKRLKENALNIDFCDVSVKEKLRKTFILHKPPIWYSRNMVLQMVIHGTLLYNTKEISWIGTPSRPEDSSQPTIST